MPWFDWNWPNGNGPMTWRWKWPCWKFMWRFGFQRWRNLRRWFSNGFAWKNWSNRYSSDDLLDNEENKKMLKAELEELNKQKKDIEEALDSLD